ncbi:DUF2442 domain-containing protein [Geobacter sp. SVR]|uniref:DUF2442 domain-containing protein n=1 Tax=Geobacter sp. SVR TaxID=2495594 RepID=UPI00143F023A|nr:DUF2442 domain-containing protein [Geobacter sp. SVR]BCS54265.1 hypothetical protein GSVR_25730 [Geobacter sp. SVR]GCF85877.1 hypothetical protein GSbR_24770 [Geobacter sp. SVR]
MKPYHEVKNVMVTDASLQMTVDGKEYEFILEEISSRLFNSSGLERSRFEVSPAGYGIHWPLLDEDLSIDGLLGIKHELPAKLAA